MAGSSGCLGFEVDQKTHAATDIQQQCTIVYPISSVSGEQKTGVVLILAARNLCLDQHRKYLLISLLTD